jgi:hypothetical protein
MEQQSAVEFLLEKYKSQNTLLFADDFEQAKEMEKQNEKNACLLAISQYLYKQAVQESEKKDKIQKQDKIHIVSRENGTIIRINEQWMVSHNLIDPFGQIPLALPIHINSYIATQLTENQNVYFDIVFEKNKYFALI